MSNLFHIFKVDQSEAKRISEQPDVPHIHNFEELMIGIDGELEHFIDSNTDLPVEHSEKAIYIAKGNLELSGRTYSSGQMIVCSKKETATIQAKTTSEFMILGGEPLGERFIWWNFVSSSRERIEQAKNDWETGKIILPPNDNKEFIPLPETRLKPASSEVPPPEPLS